MRYFLTIAILFVIFNSISYSKNSNDSIYTVYENMHKGWYIHKKADYNIDELKLLITGNAKAMEYLNTSQTYHSISHYLLGLGLGLNCYAFVSAFGFDKEQWYFAYIGATAIGIGALNITIAGLYRDKAIEVYNSDIGVYKPKESGELKLYFRLNGIGLAYLF